MKHNPAQSAVLQGIVAEKDRIKAQRDMLLAELKDAHHRCSQGWCDLARVYAGAAIKEVEKSL